MKSRSLLSQAVVSGLLFFQLLSVSASDLTSDIQEVIKGKNAQVGVAVLYKDDAVTVNNEDQYPLMSVFKFHIALAVLKKMEQEGIPLTALVTLGPSDIDTKTWSPMYKKYKSKEITLSYGDLINYMVSQSDNNACNWLINFVGGIQNVNAFIKDLGIDQIQLIETEKSMEQDIRKNYNNWSTPLSVAQLLRKVYTEKVLSDEYFAFLEKAMLASQVKTSSEQASRKKWKSAIRPECRTELWKASECVMQTWALSICLEARNAIWQFWLKTRKNPTLKMQRSWLISRRRFTSITRKTTQ